MASASPRFLSLDVFRGMTICFMIIVNTPGSNGAFWPLNHAAWNGFTPTDLVFPSFLFAVGNAMSFTMKKYQQMGNSAVLGKIFKRTILIFLIGYLMYWFPFFNVQNGHWSLRPVGETRIMGVLQRIALCYCFASLMVHYLKKNSVYILSGVFLVGYWVILLVWGDPANPLGMLTNAGTYLDKWVLGDAHLYHGEGVAFDPEGILSTIPSIVNVIIGFYAGKFIQEKGKGYETISRLILTGCLFIFIAICWDAVFPINKKLWTSSFVFITTGIDLVIISFLIFIVEIKEWRAANWPNFFTVVGKNPLFVYIVSELILIILSWVILGGKSVPQWVDNFWQSVAHGKIGSLLFAITVMLTCWLVGYILDKRKIYIRV
ncbi:acyltransferase family protein [Mucilaginibacter sp.]|jgi:predicted acyltransferase|uniref:acyltransferase family protein n=1 Tax=Mucilaginibacter sp. TaxID=1882438 RepID=UPI002B9D3E9E|nr:heparan-alpha-glucosaminide N-acetyltransferase domain-containing protein [Mucilaginibacter sp.]HTI59440.1 heparan-alpha-glucosaminide N-acetyltransferase domain-containing protein [Mucilaginibacter sp.]